MTLGLPTGTVKSPLSVGQQHTPTNSDRTYEWNGKGWIDATPEPAIPPVISETTASTAPISPSNGDKWIDSATSIKYTYVTEESAWVEL